jgi:hypothetical protein
MMKFLPPATRGARGTGNLLTKVCFPIFNLHQRSEPLLIGSPRRGAAPGPPQKLFIIKSQQGAEK